RSHRIGEAAPAGPVSGRDSLKASGVRIRFRRRDPDAFRWFLLELQEEKEFAGPFREQFGGGVPDLWREFVASLGPE
ncbi:hypothetical protein ACFL5A_04295, partial [Gemmatimonadota bacterium]